VSAKVATAEALLDEAMRGRADDDGSGLG